MGPQMAFLGFGNMGIVCFRYSRALYSGHLCVNCYMLYAIGKILAEKGNLYRPLILHNRIFSRALNHSHRTGTTQFRCTD